MKKNDTQGMAQKQADTRRKKLLIELEAAANRTSREISRVLNHPRNMGKIELGFIPAEHDFVMMVCFMRERDILEELRDLEEPDRKLGEITRIIGLADARRKSRETRPR